MNESLTNKELADAIDFTLGAIHRTAQAQDPRRPLLVSHLAALLDAQKQRSLPESPEVKP